MKVQIILLTHIRWQHFLALWLQIKAEVLTMAYRAPDPVLPLPKLLLGSSVQFSHSVAFNSLWPMDCSMPGLPVHHQLLEFTQTHVHWVGNANQPSHPLYSPSPPTFNLSQHKVLFKWVILGIRWPKYWSFSFSISPTNEYSGLISFRMDWFDLLAV